MSDLMYNTSVLTGVDSEKLNQLKQCIDNYDAFLDARIKFKQSIANIRDVYNNNHKLVEGNCTKNLTKINPTDSDNINAVFQKISEFDAVCRKIVIPSEDVFKDFDATFLYYISGTFPTNSGLTDLLHKKLVDDYSENEGVKKLFLASMQYLNVYAWKCDKNSDEEVKEIQGYFGKIFDQDGNIKTLQTVEQMINENECTLKINELLKGGLKSTLESVNSNWGDILIAVQKKDEDEHFKEVCMQFSEDHTRLEEIEKHYEEYDVDYNPTCGKIKSFPDPQDKNVKPFENKEIVDLLSISLNESNELFSSCGISLEEGGLV